MSPLTERPASCVTDLPPERGPRGEQGSAAPQHLDHAGQRRCAHRLVDDNSAAAAEHDLHPSRGSVMSAIARAIPRSRMWASSAASAADSLAGVLAPSMRSRVDTKVAAARWSPFRPRLTSAAIRTRSFDTLRLRSPSRTTTFSLSTACSSVVRLRAPLGRPRRLPDWPGWKRVWSGGRP
jgi:hypothetical protein